MDASSEHPWTTTSAAGFIDIVLEHEIFGGRSWNAQQPIRDGSDISSIFFIDEQTGWFSSRPHSVIYRTDDKGMTWRGQQVPSPNIDIASVHFVTREEGWAVGTDRELSRPRDKIWGVVLHTVNGGQTWRLEQIGNSELFYTAVFFSDVKNGWLLGRDSVYRTQDGGNTWDKVLNLPPAPK